MNVRRNMTDTIAHGALLLCTLVVLVPLFLIVAVLISRGISAVDFGFLTELPSHGNREGGIYPAIIGTVYLVGMT
ncbi:MAG: phosphate ABC transporter permease PstA, partial [Planctomycetota bacterium]